MYLRFTTTAIDEGSHKPRGLFTEAHLLLNSGELSPDEWQIMRGLLDWFNEHLPHPPKAFNSARAIFWFRDDAQECIRKVWEVAFLLREHDRNVIVHRCEKLANVKYSDHLQVAAFPSKGDTRVFLS